MWTWDECDNSTISDVEAVKGGYSMGVVGGKVAGCMYHVSRIRKRRVGEGRELRL
jgi:hypothetical protein